MNTLDQFTTYALIDLDALDHNIRTLKNWIAPGVELMAVLKANAYGHGAVPIARAAIASGVTRLVVARPDEGIQLRRAGIDVPILVNGYSPPSLADTFVTYNLTATVNTIEMAQALSARAGALGKMATIHVKVDSGMGRYGLLPDEMAPFLTQIGKLPHLDLEGMFTHFAIADEKDKTYTRKQLATFVEVSNAARQAGYTIRLRHAANSAAAIELPETQLDAVRCGIALYGLRPSPEVSNAIPLKPILSLNSRVGRIRTLPPSSAIGYGCTYVTSKPTRIALIPIGYGDGYRRAFSNNGFVLIRGQRAAIVGRVSMDQITVDVTGIEDVSQDDAVTLIGTQGDASATADEIAGLIGTINYEITTSLLPRIPRIYAQNGQIVEVLCPLCTG
ncbi:MAG: alanine racemase [Anaerolineae bacterium]|nr:alanine racemase [Anaerolineae bacterium]